MADHTYLKKQIERHFPELTGGLHLDRYGRVIAIADAPTIGASSERFRPRFAVDIEILTPDLEPDPDFPHYSAVPLPVPTGAGGEAGTFSFPSLGTLVVVGFVYGRQDHPIIRQIYPMGDSLPKIKPDEILLQRSPDVYQKADEKGNWIRQSSAEIIDDSIGRTIRAVTHVKEVCSDTENISEHKVVEVEGMALFEVGTQLTMLAGTRADIGTLGELNLTSGTNSTHSTAKDATETVGENHFSIVKKNRKISIQGGKTETVEGMHSSTVKKDRDILVKGKRNESIEKDQKLNVGGEHTETAEKNRIIKAKNIILNAQSSFSLISGKDGSSVNFFNELHECLKDIRSALDVLATHNHPNVGTINQGTAVASLSKNAEKHRQTMESITK